MRMVCMAYKRLVVVQFEILPPRVLRGLMAYCEDESQAS